MKKTIKFTAAVAMIGLMAFASAGCGGDDKKAAAAKDTLKFGVTNFADSLEPTDNWPTARSSWWRGRGRSTAITGISFSI